MHQLRIRNIWLPLLIVISLVGLLNACTAMTSLSSRTPVISNTDMTVPTDTPIPSPTSTSTITSSPTITSSSTITNTPTITDTPTITLTPTFDFPDGVVVEQSNCRYGPATAYLFAAGLYTGDKVEIWGRNNSGTWLWVQPETVQYQCWVAASQLIITGDIFSVWVKSVKLPHSTLYGPVQKVSSRRSGNQVIVTWEPVWMTVDDDRGYLIEANVCQGGVVTWHAYHTDDNSFTLIDEPGCSGASSALLYVVEKHGYTDPIQVPWP